MCNTQLGFLKNNLRGIESLINYIYIYINLSSNKGEK